jgi:hypothetical protein
LRSVGWFVTDVSKQRTGPAVKCQDIALGLDTENVGKARVNTPQEKRKVWIMYSWKLDASRTEGTLRSEALESLADPVQLLPKII